MAKTGSPPTAKAASPQIAGERNLGGEIRIGTWAGQEHLTCAKCAFDAFEREVMLKHLFERHNSEAAMDELIALEQARAPKKKAASKDAPIAVSESHVAAVIELSDDDIQALLDQAEGEQDGKNKPE